MGDADLEARLKRLLEGDHLQPAPTLTSLNARLDALQNNGRGESASDLNALNARLANLCKANNTSSASNCSSTAGSPNGVDPKSQDRRMRKSGGMYTRALGADAVEDLLEEVADETFLEAGGLHSTMTHYRHNIIGQSIGRSKGDPYKLGVHDIRARSNVRAQEATRSVTVDIAAHGQGSSVAAAEEEDERVIQSQADVLMKQILENIQKK